MLSLLLQLYHVLNCLNDNNPFWKTKLLRQNKWNYSGEVQLNSVKYNNVDILRNLKQALYQTAKTKEICEHRSVEEALYKLFVSDMIKETIIHPCEQQLETGEVVNPKYKICTHKYIIEW